MLIVAPARCSATTAATSESGSEMAATKALRQFDRNAASTSSTSAAPTAIARVRLEIESSTYEASLNTLSSTCTPGRPRLSSASACSTPRVTSSVLAPGNFSITSSSPLPLLTNASPITGECENVVSAMSPSAIERPVSSRCGEVTAILAMSSGVSIGIACSTPSRWLGLSIQPPEPGDDARRKDSGETHSASPAAVMMSSCDTRALRSLSGSKCTCNWRSRWPQIETLLTPGTPTSLGFMVQRASSESSVESILSDETPTIMKRLVADKGCRITGGVATLGSV